MSYFNQTNVSCRQPLVKVTATHKSVSMTVLCPPIINSNFILLIYIVFKVYIRNSALYYQFDHVSTLANECGNKPVLMA